MKIRSSNYLTKLRTAFLFTLIIFFVISQNQFASAETRTHQVSVSTGPRQIGPATIQIDYVVEFDFSKPSSARAGDSVDLTLSPKNGKLRLTVDVAGSTHTIEKEMALGSENTFNVAPAIDAYVSTSASSIASIEGPVDIKTKSLQWSGTNSENFRLLVSGNAKGGDEILVSVPVIVNVNAGLNLNLLDLYKQNLAQMRLGSFDATPVIEEKIPIEFTLSPEIIVIPIVVGIAIAAAVVYLKKIRKSTGAKHSSHAAARICRYCSAPIPEKAKFCAKCGKRMN